MFFSMEKSSLTVKRKLSIVAAVLFCFGVAACDSNDGPAEKAGESIDKTATDVGNKVEDKCEEAKDSLGMKDTRC